LEYIETIYNFYKNTFHPQTRSLSVSLNMSMTRTLVPDPLNGTENKLSQEF